jgi:hypothetical protein
MNWYTITAVVQMDDSDFSEGMDLFVSGSRALEKSMSEAVGCDDIPFIEVRRSSDVEAAQGEQIMIYRKDGN